MVSKKTTSQSSSLLSSILWLHTIICIVVLVWPQSSSSFHQGRPITKMIRAAGTLRKTTICLSKKQQQQQQQRRRDAICSHCCNVGIRGLSSSASTSSTVLHLHHQKDPHHFIIPAMMNDHHPWTSPRTRQHGATNSRRRWHSSMNPKTSSSLHATIEETDLADTTVVLDNSAATNLQRHDSTGMDKRISDIPKSPDTEEGLFEGLKSRPVEGGSWNPQDPIGWSRNFGRRSPEYEQRLQKIIKLNPGDEGYFEDINNRQKIPDVTIVRTKEQARIVMDKLMSSPDTIFHACDTEVMDIDLKTVGPVGNGYVTCASIYSGPDFDYGLGEDPGSTLWIDNLDDACGILQEFKPFFESPNKLKIWHNYGFDRHVMWNEGIDCVGFGGDTMHMARLQDTSRLKSGNGGYSLEALTESLLRRRKKPMKEIFGVPRLRKDGTPGSLVDVPPIEVMQRDPRFRKNFILYSCYDAEGTWQLHSKLVELLEKLEWYPGRTLYEYYWDNMREFGHVLTDMERRGIRVNAKDYLAGVEEQARKDREQHRLNFVNWAATKIGVDGLALNPASSVQLATFLFGGAKNQKTKEYTEATRVFKVAREEITEEALEAYAKAANETQSGTNDDQGTDQLDIMTAVQLKALCKEQGLKVSGKKEDLKDRLRDHLMSGGIQEGGQEKQKAGDDLEGRKVAELKAMCKENGLKVSGKKTELIERLREHLQSNASDDTATSENVNDEFDQMTDEELRVAMIARNLIPPDGRQARIKELREDEAHIRELEVAVAQGELVPVAFTSLSEALEQAAKRGGVMQDILAEVEGKSTESKFIDVTISSLGMNPEKYTAGGAPSVTADVLKGLAGDPFENPPKYGSAYEFFGGGDAGHEACVALFSLFSIGSIDTMIANFLTSLQSLVDDQSRVHCSLNINTETGRLSSRRPNLQNQPALEKDKYKIRKAFESAPGHSLIVADYGQLELRLLASMTRCRSMIDAFESGGDFHSRTALDMFDYVQEKVNNGEVLLEWDYANGEPTKPLLKDEFASERRKAKTLNFSIAYGKTAHGLSADWGVTQQEAQEMLDKWYDARPEVRDWQAKTKAYARRFGLTRTLMGRYRNLPEAVSGNKKFLGHAERASINTPIQGGAADVAMMAMNKISKSEKLRRLGWILLMQIHDEVILEGPEETAAEAFEEVIGCMEAPWVPGLAKTAVPLLVDGSYEHKTWYEAK